MDQTDIEKISNLIADKVKEDINKNPCPLGLTEGDVVADHDDDHEFIKTWRGVSDKFISRLSNIGITIAIIILFTGVALIGLLFMKLSLTDVWKLVQ